MDRDEIFEKFGEIYGKGKQFIMDRLRLDVTDLIRAANKNDIELAYRALQAGVDPNKSDGINRLPLPIAVENNCIEIVELMCASKVNPNILDVNGETPLYKAVMWENIEIIKMLLEVGAKTDLANLSGATPMDAAKSAKDPLVIPLLQGQANQGDVEKVKEDRLAQDRATHERLKAEAAAADAARAAAILRQSKDAKQLDAIKKQKEGELTGAQPTGKTTPIPPTPTETSAEELAAKAKADEVAAKAAAEKAEAEKVAAEKVAAASATVESRYKVDEIGYFSAFVMAIMKKDNAAFKTFLPKIENYNQYDELTKESPLTASILFPKIFDLLLENGADPYFTQEGMPAALPRAIEKGTIGILPVLAQEKVELNRETQGKTPLGWALHFKKKDWVIGLLHEGADPNFASDSTGSTALIDAVKAGDQSMVELLLANKADATLADKSGNSAWDYAEQSGNEDMIKLLA